MCGIAGVLAGPGAARPELDELRRMAAMLGHRGPDGHGLLRDGALGFAHARLSLVGLADGGQPLANEDGSLWLVANGEVFNHVELRALLIGRGHRFRTHSDCEVILHAFEEWGPAAWAKLNGQFAFALWDRRSATLWLVRDRLGILPLFWTRSGGAIAFASEAKGLFAGGRVAPQFDRRGISAVFTFWSAPAPASPFTGIHAVRPGCALAIGADLSTAEQCWWQPRIEPDEVLSRLSADEAADALEALLAEAIRLRLRADVPVGSYLSGGVDSSLISALAAKGQPELDTFSVRFVDPRFDETGPQRVAARLIGSRHHEIVCAEDDLRRDLPEVIWHCETPLMRTSPVPLRLLSGLVRDAGMKAVLTGEGADELLAGYDIFKEDRIRRWWAKRPDSKLRPALLGRLHPDVAAAALRGGALWQAFFRTGMTERDQPFYAHLPRWRNTAWSLRFLAPSLRLDGPEALEADAAQAMPKGWRDWSPLARAQATEIATFMSPYLLSCQGDRVAMANGVEARYPFLDPSVVDFCLGLPDPLKLRGLADKLTLRRLAARHLPPEIARRPKKPYRAPIAPAFFGPQAPDYVDDLLSEAGMRRLGLLDPAVAAPLVDKARRQSGNMAGEREEMALIGALTLQLLGHHFLESWPDRLSAAERRLGEPQVLIDGVPSSSSLTTR
ncbi:MAG: asparagine synthase (glutamine-hydrolyzing) [Alphaproteobacteria bacterium]|nr:asparagine synthase (glutamine-hydrolyzing) [Alphaproteobacteria bacterium]